VVAVAGAVLGALIQQLVPHLVLLSMFALLAAVVLAREIGLVRFPLPENPRLVPERVAQLGEVGALQFGFELGTGMRTYSPSALPHLALVGVLLVFPLSAAPLLALGFALGRFAMPLLSNAYADDGSWTTLWRSAESAVRPLLAASAIGALLLVGVPAALS
jgi:hypothetical protein